jgi:thioredoxin 1
VRQSIGLAVVAALAATLSAGCTQRGPAAPSVSSGPVVALDDSTFDARIESGVVLVDFWAAWCGPCRMQGPIVEKVAEQVEGRATVAKLDVDAASAVAQRFNIQSIPTLIVFKDGEPAKQFVGVTQAEALVAAIDSALESE